MSMYKDAIADFESALVLEPANKQAKAEIKKLKQSGMAFWESHLLIASVYFFNIQ